MWVMFHSTWSKIVMIVAPINGLEQNCSNSSAPWLPMELLQSCAKPPIHWCSVGAMPSATTLSNQLWIVFKVYHKRLRHIITTENQESQVLFQQLVVHFNIKMLSYLKGVLVVEIYVISYTRSYFSIMTIFSGIGIYIIKTRRKIMGILILVKWYLCIEFEMAPR